MKISLQQKEKFIIKTVKFLNLKSMLIKFSRILHLPLKFHEEAYKLYYIYNTQFCLDF